MTAPVMVRQIEHWPIERLVPYARNARTHSEAQIAQIAASIIEFGFVNPILVESGAGILAGHGRYAAARKLGLAIVPVIPLDHLSEAQKRAYILADNRIAESSGWDEELLAAELREIEVDLNLALTGFDSKELERLLASGDGDDPRADECPDVQDDAVTRPGDLWMLGRHRVLCGDATNREDVSRLMDGAKADMVFTDPPYGISAVKVSRRGNGTVGNEGGTPFGGGGRGQIGVAKAFGRIRGRIGGNNIIEANWYAPVIGDDSTDTAVAFYRLCAELQVPVLIFWGGNYYANALPPSRCWIAWDKENTGDFADCELAWTNLDSPARLFRHMWNGLMKASERGESRVHPTQKPVALAVWAIEQFGKEAERCFDGFLGSGSTLIACEKANRACYGTELSAHYVDVIVKRWQEYTKQQATLEGDGRTFAEVSAERAVTSAMGE